MSTVSDHVNLEEFIAGVKRRNPGQPEFVQAVQEVAEDIFDYIQDKVEYHEYQILRRISDADLHLLGFDQTNGRPEWMLIKELLVAPPSPGLGGGG